MKWKEFPPPGAWYTEISGWHRVRISTPNCDNEEIGCGTSKEKALEEAWEWWLKAAAAAIKGECWYCVDYDYTEEEVCFVCKEARAALKEK